MSCNEKLKLGETTTFFTKIEHWDEAGLIWTIQFQIFRIEIQSEYNILVILDE